LVYQVGRTSVPDGQVEIVVLVLDVLNELADEELAAAG